MAGTPVSFSFDPKTAEFHLLYIPKPKISAPTVVFVPLAVHYPHGYCASVVGGTILSKPGASHLLIANNSDAPSVSVSIKASTCSGSHL